MINHWTEKLQLTDLVLIAVLVVCDLYLWLSVFSEVRLRWRRRSWRISHKEWFLFRPPPRLSFPLIVAAFAAALTSIWLFLQFIR